MLLRENYYLKANRLLGEDINGSKIINLLKTIIGKFGIDMSMFNDPNKLKKFIGDNAQYFDKANDLYNRFVGVKSEGREYMSEGIFDFFRGLNKGIVAMFVVIALSGMANKSHASIKDLSDNTASIVNLAKSGQFNIGDYEKLAQQAEDEGLNKTTIKDIIKRQLHDSGVDPEKYEKILDSSFGEKNFSYNLDAKNIRDLIPSYYMDDIENIMNDANIDPGDLAAQLSSQIANDFDDVADSNPDVSKLLERFGGAGSFATALDQYLYKTLSK